MTENEIILEIRNMQRFNYTLADNEVFEKAIQALEEMQKIKELGDCYIIPKNSTWEVNGIDVHKSLEEIQQYRAIGTVEGFERAIKSSIENYNIYKEYKAKVQEFEAIGTIEDFKALKEKSVAKKPSKDEFDRFICPDCGWIVSTEEYGGRFLPHCENCGQAIDWSE